MNFPLKSSLADRDTVRSSERAFTMIEIAVSLAIIAFALVAIIGVLPQGLNVQRDNRDETTLAQDGEFLLNAIRQGVTATNISILSSNIDWLYYSQNGLPGVLYTNGLISSTQIVAYLSMPTVAFNPLNPIVPNTNFVMAKFRRFNGPLADQSSVGSPFAPSYVVVPSITNSLNYTNFLITLSNAAPGFAFLNSLSNNSFEVRLTLQSPWLNGDPSQNNLAVGSRRLVLRTTVASTMTNFFPQGSALPPQGNLFVPNTFVGP
jgi:type II secretory pathway pseudopilin PulG